MNRRFLSFLLISALFCVAVASAQEQPKQKPPVGGRPKPFNLPKSEVFKLQNGLQVTLTPYGTVPKVTVSAVIRAGNLNEADNQVWLADLMGDLMKEGAGTRNATQLAEDSARLGGAVNVRVGLDTMTVAGDALSEFGPQLVALVGDVATKPTLPESELPRLKNNRLRQLSVQRAQPGALANERFRKLLYPNHAYGRIFPTEEMIKGYTIDDVRKFYQNNLGAARTHIYVAGVFDAAAMKRAIAAAFENWQAGKPPLIDIPKPVAAGGIHLIDRPGAAQSTLYIGLPAIDPTNPDYIPLIVTDSLLGGSFSSRITTNIREQKGYTYSPSSQISVRYRDGYWVEVADVTTAVTGPALKEIFAEIERLRKEPPPADELQGIKNNLAGIFVLQNSSRGGVINQLSYVDLHGLPADYLSTFVPKALAVTPEEVRRIAEKYLPSTKMSVVVVGDKAKISEQLQPFGKITEAAGN
jgi:predicted Zn-dependent peptidase